MAPGPGSGMSGTLTALTPRRYLDASAGVKPIAAASEATPLDALASPAGAIH